MSNLSTLDKKSLSDTDKISKHTVPVQPNSTVRHCLLHRHDTGNSERRENIFLSYLQSDLHNNICEKFSSLKLIFVLHRRHEITQIADKRQAEVIKCLSAYL